MVVWGSTRTMAFSVGSQQCRRLVEIVDDDPPVEAIDHAVAEADGDDCCPHWVRSCRPARWPWRPGGPPPVRQRR